MSEKPMKVLYDTLLSIPGMNENVKIDLRISRRMVLLLTQVIGDGINSSNAATTDLLDAFPENGKEGLQRLIEDCLAKAELTDLNHKLQSLQAANNGK